MKLSERMDMPYGTLEEWVKEAANLESENEADEDFLKEKCCETQ